MRLNQQHPETRRLFGNVGLLQKSPDCFPLCLAVRYKIANSDEMKNTLAVLEKNPVKIKVFNALTLRTVIQLQVSVNVMKSQSVKAAAQHSRNPHVSCRVY